MLGYLEEVPPDPIMGAGPEWTELQRTYEGEAINTTVGVLLDPETGLIWRPAKPYLTVYLSITMAIRHRQVTRKSYRDWQILFLEKTYMKVLKVTSLPFKHLAEPEHLIVRRIYLRMLTRISQRND